MGVLDDILTHRQQYLDRLKTSVLFERPTRGGGLTASVADKVSADSAAIAAIWGKEISTLGYGSERSPQDAGAQFQAATGAFVEAALSLLAPARPATWTVAAGGGQGVERFDQYFHLSQLRKKVVDDPDLKTMFGGEYFVRPDIVVYRAPLDPASLGGRPTLGRVADLSPLLADAHNSGGPILHASISCKLTMRSDRAQNTRTEALNLIRNRKGRLPHVVAVTAEPLPGRLESLALGTGDLDCVYHAGLYELEKAVESLGRASISQALRLLIEGRRLRDISDLPLDLAL